MPHSGSKASFIGIADDLVTAAALSNLIPLRNLGLRSNKNAADDAEAGSLAVRQNVELAILYDSLHCLFKRKTVRLASVAVSASRRKIEELITPTARSRNHVVYLQLYAGGFASAIEACKIASTEHFVSQSLGDAHALAGQRSM
jgi:hypothetical protein